MTTAAREPDLRRPSGTAVLELGRAIREVARPLRDAADLAPLVDQCRDASLVLLGEATHGSREFYRTRAELTRRLIDDLGFDAVALEADWPATYRLNRFVRALGSDAGAIDALADFRRFPRWMWRNTEVADFASWLREHNDGLGRNAAKVGIYGLDLYSLDGSIQAVIAFLDKTDPAAARRARERYGCFGDFGEDPRRYGHATTAGLLESCEPEVVAQLVEMQRRSAELVARDGFAAEDEAFCAEQNARVAQNAEHYYRSVFSSSVSSWNVRDTHMTDTLDTLQTHIARRRGGAPAKLVVWAHNSHLGDARATELGDVGEVNVGSLARQRHGRTETRLIGFTTFRGSVSAASDWDGPVETKTVRPARADAYESVLHEAELPRFALDLRARNAAVDALAEPRLERAIGVIYRPETERESHYFTAWLAEQFDVVIHCDETHALEPLDREPERRGRFAAETFPSGV